MPARIGGRWRISPPTNTEQAKLYWTDERIVDGENPIQLGANNCGKSVGGSTVHFAMVSLRFRPEWFKARTMLGYGADWPLDWREMWRYYAEVEQALKISGPVNYPWGPKRPRYPYRPHELNAAALVLAQGAEALGIDWAPTPLATVSAPRGHSPPCVYRGLCVIGCSTNAKQSVLITWLPRALAAGAEIRDLAMVGRIEHDDAGRVTGVHYHPRGTLALSARAQCRRRRLCDRDAAAAAELRDQPLSRWPRQFIRPGRQESDGAVQPGGLGRHGAGNPLVQGAAVARHHRALELRRHGKDFFGGYAYMSQGPLPVGWSGTLSSKRGLWGNALLDEMEKYNHQVGLKIVGECTAAGAQPRDACRRKGSIRPAGAAHHLLVGRQRQAADRAFAVHSCARRSMPRARRDIWDETDDTCHLNGTARMGD